MNSRIDTEKYVELQRKMAGKVVLDPPFASLSGIRTVCGLDVKYPEEDRAVAAAVVMTFPGLEPVEKSCAQAAVDPALPYVSGLFAFRELPPLLEAIKKLTRAPDVFICDGAGIAHPRRFGLAAQLGVTLAKPAIGCAKTHLYGEFAEPPPGLKGAYQFLKDPGGDILGVVLRTKAYTRPLFISPGHLMNVDMAGDIILACCTAYRIPEPLRAAHALANDCTKGDS